jgi:alanine racemase
MIRFLRKLIGKSADPYSPLITVEISKKALLHNLNQFRTLAPNGVIAPVLKSNAYGHGLIQIASLLEKYGNIDKKNGSHESSVHIPFFVVDSFYEACELRKAGIKTHLLVIGFTRPETILASRLKKVSFAITSIEQLRSIDDINRNLSIHIKIDTGMRRQGIMPHEINEAIEILEENPYIEINGICSHLSDADNFDPSFTEEQISIWNKIVNQFNSKWPNIKHLHLSNTDGHIFSPDIKANISRLGIGLYGLSSNDSLISKLDLQPVMQIKSIITGTKKLSKDETTGYANSFKADRNMRIATIPFGYYEGMDRRLSNIGTIIVGKNRIPCPVIGRVSMNITTIDITNVPEAKMGTEVIVISNVSGEQNSISMIAKKCNTITYDIAVHIPEHLKRVVI